MNILFLSTRLPYPPKNGHFQRTYNILKHLSQKHKIYLVSFYVTGLSNSQQEEYDRAMRSVCAEVHTFHTPFESGFLSMATTGIASLLGKKPLIARKYYSREMAACIRDIVDRNSIDFVHYDMLPMHEYRRALPDYDCLLTEHNVEYYRYERWIDKESNPVKRWYIKKQYRDLKRYEIDVVGKYSRCIVVSDYDRRVLQEHSPETEFYVVPNGTDTDYFQPVDVDRKPNHLIWVGGLSMWPNRDAVEYFVREVFPIVSGSRPDVVFDVVGMNKNPIFSEAEKPENVIFHGFVDDARPMMSAAAVYVAPIRIGSGTKLKILDAMAMRKCVVTTTIGLEGIDATHGEDVFVCDTPEDFAATTLRLLDDPDTVERVASAARETVMNKYAWPAVFRKLDEVYE